MYNLSHKYCKRGHRPLTGSLRPYVTSTGQVACALSFECAGDYTLFDSSGIPSQTLFLPDSALNLPAGTHQLKVQLSLCPAEDGRLLQSSNRATFTFSR